MALPALVHTRFLPANEFAPTKVTKPALRRAG